MDTRYGAQAVVMAGGLLCLGQAVPQVVNDGTWGKAGPLSGPSYQITPEIGHLVSNGANGGNLFYSLEQFSLRTGESATFSGPAGVRNVLTRVTGGQESSINGVVACRITDANLYLMNPAGVVFGEGGSVDVTGGFAVTSADYIALADGGRFDASRSGGGLLTSADPVAFGFVRSGAGNISAKGARLRVAAEESLHLVGGNVLVGDPDASGGGLEAPGGKIVVGAVQSPGEFPLAPQNATLPWPVANQGAVEIKSGAAVDASPRSAQQANGVVVIRAGRLLVEEAGSVTSTGLNPDATSGGVNIRAGEVTIRGGEISAPTGEGGAGGTLTIEAGVLVIEDDGTLSADVLADGRQGGELRVRSEQVTLRDGGEIRVENYGLGAGPKLTISGPPGDGAESGARDVTLESGAAILAGNWDRGTGGSVTITSERLSLGDFGTTILADTYGPGAAGRITVRGGQVNVADGARIESASLGTLATGGAGAIRIDVSDSVTVSGGGHISTRADHAPAGDVTIRAGRTIELSGTDPVSGGSITAYGNSDGNVNLWAGERIYLLDTRIDAHSRAGEGGNIVLGPDPDAVASAAMFVILNRSELNAYSVASAGGNVTIAPQYLLLSADSSIDVSGTTSANSGELSLSGATLTVTPDVGSLRTPALEAPTSWGAPEGWKGASLGGYEQVGSRRRMESDAGLRLILEGERGR